MFGEKTWSKVWFYGARRRDEKNSWVDNASEQMMLNFKFNYFSRNNV